MSNNKIHKDKLKVLLKSIYTASTVNYTTKDSDTFTVLIGTGSGIISKFTLETVHGVKTDTYLESLKTLFFHSFLDKDTEFKNSRNKKDIEREDVIRNALLYFSDIDEINAILKTCVKDKASSHRRFVPTTESIFDVMEHYDTIQGVPIICTEAQFEACKERYENRYDSDSETDISEVAVESLTFEEFCREHPDALDSLGKYIYPLLAEVMIPVFSKVNPSEEEMENDYNSAYERIKSDMTKHFESEARKRLCTNGVNNIKKVILIDKDCKINDLQRTMLYYPDCAPVLSSWQIPVHQYKVYHVPNYTKDDIIDVLVHPARLNSSFFPLAHLQADEQMKCYPISEIQIPYTQNKFYEFQIHYMTSQNKFQRNGLFSIYNADIVISGEIKARWPEKIWEHWKGVWDSIQDILQKLFSINFIDLIEENNPIDEGVLYDLYLDIFLQEDALMLEKNTYSEFLPKELIQKHYFFEHAKSDEYVKMFGEDYISQVTMKQIAYVVIPLIGRFVSELRDVMYDIAGVIGEIATKNEYDFHVKQIVQYLKDDKLNFAIKVWDDTYSSRKKYELKEKRRVAMGGITLNPDYRLLGLMNYANKNGNLFRNLKNVLEEYLYCLQELC